MFTIKKRFALGVAWSVALGVALSGGSAVVPESSPVLAPRAAAAAAVNLKMYNTGAHMITVCNAWPYNDGRTRSANCGAGTRTANVQPGQWSPFVDTDAVMIYKGWLLEERRPRRDGTYTVLLRACNTTGANPATKVVPPSLSGVVNYRVRQC